MKNYKTIIGAAVAGLALSAVSSNAQLNLTGGTVESSLIDQTLTGVGLPASNDGVNDGIISTWVVSDSALDSQGLIFVYQVVNNTPGAAEAWDNVELTGYSSSEIVGTASDATESGLTLTGSSTPSASGNFPNFQLVSPNAATFESGNLSNGGGVSDYLVIFTDMNSYTTSYGQVQDTISADGAIYAPAAVPEANTIVAGALMLLPLGIGAVRALRKERTA